MKNIFFIFLSITLCSAQPKKVESRVTDATVFKDRAMVTRTAVLNLEKGENTVVFSDLTTNIRDETIRISIPDDKRIRILDVKVEKRFTTEIRKEKINSLQKKIDELRIIVQTATDKISVYESKKGFIESLKAESVKYANQKILTSSNSTKEWNDLLKFIDNNLSEIFNGIREHVNKKVRAEQEIKSLQLTIDQSKSGEEKNFKEIIVKIDAAENKKVKLEISYIVNSANWYPIYDARVSSKTVDAEISFFAMVQQSTGEDWNDVNLSFSTSNPLSMKSLPKLDKWFIDVNPFSYKPSSMNLRGGRVDDIPFQVGGYEAKFISYEQNQALPKGTGSVTGYLINKETGEALIGANVTLEGTSFGSTTDRNGKFYLPNVPVANYYLAASQVGFNKYSLLINIVEKNIVNMSIPLEATDLNLSEIIVTDKKFLEEKFTNTVKIIDNSSITDLPIYSDIKAKDISTTFKLNTNNSIPSDNSPHKVTVAVSNLPIEFSYAAVPKVLPNVFLRGKILNSNDYPLLEGEINIFVDNEFVNRTHINTIVASDTLELALGIDEGLEAEKILKNRFVESKGLFGGSTQITYEYEIRVTNNHKTEETILVYDQQPVPMNEKIIVELVSPAENEKILNDKNELEWKIKIKPGEKRIIPLKFYVSFPVGTNVYGLE